MPIERAVKYGRADVIDMFVSAGAGIDTFDRRGFTLLDSATNREMINVLVDRGVCEHNVYLDVEPMNYTAALIASRIACRRSAVSVASLHRHANAHDKQLGIKEVFRLVAKHIWSTRMDMDEWAKQ